MKLKLEQTNHQHDLTLQCVRSTLDGLTCINRSIHMIFMQEDKENRLDDDESEELIEENLDENINLVLLSRLNRICIKLAKNIDILLRTPLSSTSKHSHPVQRHESNASSISKQSTMDDIHESPNVLYEEIIDKLTNDLELMKNRLAEEELRMYVILILFPFNSMSMSLFSSNYIEELLNKIYPNVNPLNYQRRLITILRKRNFRNNY